MGTIVNVIAIVIGSLLGLAFQGRFPERFSQSVLKVAGLFTIVIGLSMALQGQEMILVLISLALGAVLGEWINIEDRLERMGQMVETRLKVSANSPAQGFINTSLIFCVGSMAIVGSIADGVQGNASILYTKAVMDGVTSIAFASCMGIGVLGSAVSVLVYQGGITLLAMQLKPIFTPEVIRELTAVGGVMIMGIGINITGMQKVRIGNLLPALALIIGIVWLKQWLG